MAAVLFFALAMYYRSNFPVNTWINGVYCTGKTVEQVNEELVNAQEASVLSVLDADGVSWEIAMSAADIRPDFTVDLKKYLKQNATFYWLENLQQSVYSELPVERYAMDEEKLRECFDELPFVAAERERRGYLFTILRMDITCKTIIPCVWTGKRRLPICGTVFPTGRQR